MYFWSSSCVDSPVLCRFLVVCGHDLVWTIWIYGKKKECCLSWWIWLYCNLILGVFQRSSWLIPLSERNADHSVKTIVLYWYLSMRILPSMAQLGCWPYFWLNYTAFVGSTTFCWQNIGCTAALLLILEAGAWKRDKFTPQRSIEGSQKSI